MNYLHIGGAGAEMLNSLFSLCWHHWHYVSERTFPKRVFWFSRCRRPNQETLRIQVRCCKCAESRWQPYRTPNF